MTPLQLTVKYGNADVVQMLIDKGASIENIDSKGQGLKEYYLEGTNCNSVTLFLWTQQQKIWFGNNVDYNKTKHIVNNKVATNQSKNFI